MSKVPYTIDVDRYICSELELMRKMYENRDFSGMMAAIERVQFHANAMEEALYSYDKIKYKLIQNVDDEEVDDKEFREKARKVFKKYRKDK